MSAYVTMTRGILRWDESRLQEVCRQLGVTLIAWTYPTGWFAKDGSLEGCVFPKEPQLVTDANGQPVLDEQGQPKKAAAVRFDTDDRQLGATELEAFFDAYHRLEDLAFLDSTAEAMARIGASCQREELGDGTVAATIEITDEQLARLEAF